MSDLTMIRCFCWICGALETHLIPLASKVWSRLIRLVANPRDMLDFSSFPLLGLIRGFRRPRGRYQRRFRFRLPRCLHRIKSALLDVLVIGGSAAVFLLIWTYFFT